MLFWKERLAMQIFYMFCVENKNGLIDVLIKKCLNMLSTAFIVDATKKNCTNKQ